MSDQSFRKKTNLAKVIDRHTNQEGSFLTAIPALFFSRYSNVTEPKFGIYNPSFCVIVQGKKMVSLAKDRFEYGASNYL